MPHSRRPRAEWPIPPWWRDTPSIGSWGEQSSRAPRAGARAAPSRLDFAFVHALVRQHRSPQSLTHVRMPSQASPPSAVPFGIAKLTAALARLNGPRRVAVVTLCGSLCPITKAHLQALIQARRLLRDKTTTVKRPANLESFDAVVGAVSLNSDRHVGAKLRRKGDASLSLVQRRQLVKMAIRPYNWLAYETAEGALLPRLRRRFPHLEFVHFSVNGADDVLGFHKYLTAREDKRIISMGRPGMSWAVELAAAEHGINLDAGRFVIGPELADTSSSKVRLALQSGNYEEAEKMLPPGTYNWLVDHGPWQ